MSVWFGCVSLRPSGWQLRDWAAQALDKHGEGSQDDADVPVTKILASTLSKVFACDQARIYKRADSHLAVTPQPPLVMYD